MSQALSQATLSASPAPVLVVPSAVASRAVRMRVEDPAPGASLGGSTAASGENSVSRAVESEVGESVGSAAAHSAAATANREFTFRRAPISASVFAASGVAKAVDLAAQELVLKPGELLVTQTADSITRTTPRRVSEAGTIRLELPLQAFYVNEAGELKESGLAAEIAGGGLRINDDGSGFKGQVFVALEDERDRTATYRFDNPASLLVTAAVDDVDPEQFDLAGTNDWRQVSLFARSPDDLVTLRIRASVVPKSLDITVPIIRPTLTISGSPPSVQGLGLQEMTITVDAHDMPNPNDRTVTLTSTRGKLESTTVKLDSNGVATTTLRSIGAGPVTVAARSQGFAPSESEGLKFSWPFGFLVAMLMGLFLEAGSGRRIWRDDVTRLQ